MLLRKKGDEVSAGLKAWLEQHFRVTEALDAKKKNFRQMEQPP